MYTSLQDKRSNGQGVASAALVSLWAWPPCCWAWGWVGTPPRMSPRLTLCDLQVPRDLGSVPGSRSLWPPGLSGQAAPLLQWLGCCRAPGRICSPRGGAQPTQPDAESPPEVLLLGLVCLNTSWTPLCAIIPSQVESTVLTA
jgi:hypothetical protein